MKKHLFLSMLICVLAMYGFVGCGTTSAATTTSQENPTITIVNNTGFTVHYVYVSETTSDTWGTDKLMPDQVLRNGQSVSVQLLHPLSRVNRYDFRVVDDDGDEYIKSNVTVRANSRIEFTLDDIEFPSINIVNNTGYIIYYVYISETSSNTWGPDRLTSNQVLRDGQSVSIQLSRFAGTANQYDVMLIDSDGDSYVKKNVTIRTNSRIEFTIGDIDLDAFLERIRDD